MYFKSVLRYNTVQCFYKNQRGDTEGSQTAYVDDKLTVQWQGTKDVKTQTQETLDVILLCRNELPNPASLVTLVIFL